MYRKLKSLALSLTRGGGGGTSEVMRRNLTIELSLEEAVRIVKLCESEGLSPREVLLRAGGEPDREPYRSKLKQLVPRDVSTWEAIASSKPHPLGYRSGQNRAYLNLLRQLLAWNEPRVSEALQHMQGRSRSYFSKDRTELAQSKLIEAGWYACTKLNGEQKQKILCGLLRRLGFSEGYSLMISQIPCDRGLRIPDLVFRQAQQGGPRSSRAQCQPPH